MKKKDNKIILTGAILALSALLVMALLPLLYDFWFTYISDNPFPVPYFLVRLFISLSFIIGLILVFVGPFISKS